MSAESLLLMIVFKASVLLKVSERK